ncbi:MAG TPA: hypothetical protein VMW67_08405 [Desulfobacteria bacterium]|nr:hypothetical protein [Desulfobacteria bacterium]
MGEIDAIYEGGVLRLVKPARIDSDVVTVRILNRDEMLTKRIRRISWKRKRNERRVITTNWKKWLNELRSYSLSEELQAAKSF